MANHGSVGNKFLSANVNKGYGQSSHFHHSSYSGSSYGQAAAGRGRPTHAGGGSGMVVLSRPRSSQKAVPKLSVPPPLNLPSMRKEHEKFDSTGTGGGAVGGSGSGTGSRPNSSSMGWTKPAAPPVKDGTCGSQVVDGVDQSVIATDAGSRGSNAYVQPLARVSGVGQPVNSSGQAYPSRVEKAMVLRGEDFPSLQAALPLPPASGSVQKQKDSSQKKNQQLVQDDLLSPKEQSDSYRLSSPVDTRPHGQSSNPRVASESKEGGFNRFGGSRMNDQPRKPEYFPGPLPLVRLNPRSDWADDERDTGHGITERGREQGISKTEAYWDRDFELPRSSLLPHKPPNNVFERPGLRRDDIGKGFPSEVLKVDTDHRDLRTPSREVSEGKSWRPAIQKDVQQVVNDRNDLGRPTDVIRDTVMENKYTPPLFGVNKVNQNSTFVWADMGHGQNWNNSTGSYNSRGGERNTRDRYGGEQSNRHGIDDLNKFNASKSSFAPGGKGFPIHDPILNFGREKRVYTKSERPYVEDPFLKEFASTGYDGSDPFSAGLVGVIKRKKDVVKPNDFHDPVRESFEAELERVQKMQEMERQRIIDEQERALEQARREEEERQRLIREEEERQRRLEEESREAAWRAEQERLDAIRKAEELKVAREEEKKRIFIEEERRKEAAKQKLLELEARIARRQAETSRVDNSNSVTAVSDEAVFGGVKEKYISREAESDSWEDGERMVERITTSASSDSSISNRPFDMNPRPPVDGGKFVNSWRRDVFDNGNTSSFPRNYGGPGYMPTRAYFKDGVQEPHVDEFTPLKEHGWSPYGGGAESEFYENNGDRYAMGWGQGQRWYPNSDADDFYAYGRPRFSMRQPRVLPPPSLPSIHKASSIGGGDNERPGPSNSQGSESNSAKGESILQSNEPKLEKDSGPRCDSQSSLSVSSPPTSPTQLSHDELEESRNSPVKPAAAEVKEPNLYNKTTVLNENAVKDATLSAQSSVSGGEDEEWTLDNNEELQEQEEYDEDEDGYQEDDEVHEVYDEAIDMTREFDELEGKDSSHMNSLVLGFDEGVEVGIPSDEFEQDSRSEEVKFGIHEVSGNSILEERRYAENLQGDGQTIHVDVSKKIHETENTITRSLIPPQSPTTHDLLDNVVSSSVLLDNVVSSSVETTSISSSGQAIMSISSVQNQADLPLKLQFGLFSGPSLIPSPVPAIQIGSIQMPLHLHPPACPSIGHTHLSQAPLFQFGQLTYASPVPQGVLPVGHQSMSFVQPNMQTHYNMNQSSGASLPIQPNQDTSAHNVLKIADDGVRRLNSFTVRGNVENDTRSRTQISNATEGNRKNESSVEKNHDPSLSGEKDFNVSKNNQGSSYGNKGKKVSYSVKNSGFRSSFRASDDPRSDSSGFQRRPQRPIQRTEFRVRESTNKNQNQSSSSVSSNLNLDAKPNRNGKSVGYNGTGFRRGAVTNKPMKQIGESKSSSSSPIISQDVFGKETSMKQQGVTISQENADAPIQSGIVRVYEQPGIEAPSDEDDFIEVRSKRQMLNDRREQREKEIKAKSRVAKPLRKPCSSASNTGVLNKVSASLGGEGSNNNINSDFVASEGQGLMNEDGSTCFPSMVSQLLAPIGTPSVNTDTPANSRSRSIKSIEAGSASVISAGTKDIGPNLLFETKNYVLDNVQSSLGSWGNAQINQQVMSLTQTQLDDAMKSARFDSHVPSIGCQTSLTEPLLPSSSILSKEKSISSSSSPISSLLAGEKIQFGAVTSPTVLPPSSRVISHVIGEPGVFRSDIHSLPQAENDCTLFFGKDKHTNESHLEDCEAEAEAEAAASAVAAAAINSDKIVNNGNGNGSDNTKSFQDPNVDGITGVVTGGPQSGSQSRTEESLSVSLPADLSVETQPISLWPAVPGPQNSSNPMLSHFPGAPPPSHFPFYDMNSMLGGPIFTFGPHEDSSGTQSQPQKTVMSASPGHIGNWQQVHSPVDSFYGPPAGFAGPFISPTGGIPGVQSPPHMVVYNHYAPVGQFGQVGLSFMGTTYVPSGKQPDWKHNPGSSMGMGEGGMNNMNLVSAQRNPPNMPNPIQHHLAPRSPILPIASPMAMFEVSPFQTAQDMSVQARWSHVPAPPPLNSVPLSLPKQQPEAESVVLTSQFNHGHHVDQSLAPPHRFSEPQGSTPTDKSTTCPVVTKSQFPNEFGLVVDSSTSTLTSTSTHGQSSTGKTNDTVQSGNSNNSSGQSVSGNNSFKNQQKNLSGHQYNNHSSGYGYQRGGSSQKSGSSGEWAHRRMGGFHGRNQSLGAEKNFSNSKMKQVYVAKQTRSGPSTVG